MTRVEKHYGKGSIFMSSFSICHNVFFKNCLLQLRKNAFARGKGLIRLSTIDLTIMCFEKTNTTFDENMYM